MTPDKDPSMYAALANIWTVLAEPIRAAIISSVIAFFRVIYDGKEPKMVRKLLESALCGSIALGVASGIQAMGMPEGFGTFLGAAIGLFGADQVRLWGRKLAEKRINQ